MFFLLATLFAAPVLTNAYVYTAQPCGVKVNTVGPDWFEEDAESEEEALAEWEEWCRALDRYYCGNERPGD